MKGVDMAAAETGAAAGVAAAWKTGVLAGVAVVAVSVLAVLLGFKVVPLTPGRETEDATRRLAAGLLSSFTFGPLTAFFAVKQFPWVMAPWEAILKGQDVLWIYLASAAPFIGLTGVLGFWLVAALMWWFERRRGKDVGELIQDARDVLKG